jgi:hypothetical protein
MFVILDYNLEIILMLAKYIHWHMASCDTLIMVCRMPHHVEYINC